MNINNLINSTAFNAIGSAITGAAVGYVSTFILPMPPIAGMINGTVYFLTIFKTHDTFEEYNKTIKHLLEDRPDLGLLEQTGRLLAAGRLTAIVLITYVATAALAFLICLSVNIRIPFSACVAWPFATTSAVLLGSLPFLAIIKIVDFCKAMFRKCGTP